jgi:hypothetical protein
MDLAINRASGKYVTMIGDDDTILPSIFKLVEFANKNGYDAIAQKNIAAYHWPESLKIGSYGALSYKPFSAKINKPNLSKNLNLFLKNGLIDYLTFSFPKLYHGLVLRARLLDIKKQTGNFFGGLSPDIYSAISLSFYVKNFITIDYPFTIAGSCKASTTAQNISGGHRGPLNSAPHLFLRGKYSWDNRIPPYYSVESIWAESSIKGIIENKQEDILKGFNFSNFFFNAIWRGKGIRKLIIRETLLCNKGFITKKLLIFRLITTFPLFIFCKLIQKNKKTNNFFKIEKLDHIKIAAKEIALIFPDHELFLD